MSFVLKTIVFGLLVFCCASTPLNQTSINAFNQVYPRCFDTTKPTKLQVTEVETLFATGMQVTLAPKQKCSFLGGGNVQLTWEPYIDFVHFKTYNTPIIAQVLNYSKSSCTLYGGDTVEQALRNVTPG